MKHLFCGLLASLALSCPQARAAESFPPGLYEVTTETAMPHLEENLRYAITHERRCLSNQQFSSAFPVLNHESLKGCKLENESRKENSVTYLLICDNGHGTTGTAQWHPGANPIRGELNVKLGGKNMTFYQRIAAKPLGECARVSK